MERKEFIKNSAMMAFGISANKNIFKNDNNDHLDKWQPDGFGSLGKIGILTPDFDILNHESEVHYRYTGGKFSYMGEPAISKTNFQDHFYPPVWQYIHEG